MCRVQWAIDLDANSPEEADKKAREIQLDPESTATVFKVTDEKTGEVKEVDLDDLDG